MPKPQSGDDKKHGDKLENLIERTGGKAVPEDQRKQRADNPADVQDDDEDVLGEGTESEESEDEELDDEVDEELEDDEEAEDESDDERSGQQH